MIEMIRTLVSLVQVDSDLSQEDPMSFFFFELMFIVFSCGPSDLLQEDIYMCGTVFIVGR